MHWLSRNWWLLLSLGLLGWFIWGYTKIHLKPDAADTYNILVDLILIVLALIGVAGYGIYRWISRGIDDRVENRLREEQNALSSRLDTSAGFVFWEHYQQEHPLEIAIGRARRALQHAERLDEKQYEKLICTCKQNLAYYLAEQEESKDDAHKLAKYAYERARDEKGRYKYETSYQWEETYAYVLWRFAGEDKITKEKAHLIINDLVSCAQIPLEWRERINNKWGRLFLNQAKSVPNK